MHPFLMKENTELFWIHDTRDRALLPKCENTGDKISTCPPLAYRAWGTTGVDFMKFLKIG